MVVPASAPYAKGGGAPGGGAPTEDWAAAGSVNQVVSAAYPGMRAPSAWLGQEAGEEEGEGEEAPVRLQRPAWPVACHHACAPREGRRRLAWWI